MLERGANEGHKECKMYNFHVVRSALLVTHKKGCYNKHGLPSSLLPLSLSLLCLLSVSSLTAFFLHFSARRSESIRTGTGWSRRKEEDKDYQTLRWK